MEFGRKFADFVTGLRFEQVDPKDFDQSRSQARPRRDWYAKIELRHPLLNFLPQPSIVTEMLEDWGRSAAEAVERAPVGGMV